MKPEGRKDAPERTKAPGKTRRRSHGLRVLADVTAISADAEDLPDRLQRFVELIAERTETDVCSIYLLDERTQKLTLAATKGLERAAVGRVVMAVGEGLTGMTIEKLEPVMVVDAFPPGTHPPIVYPIALTSTSSPPAAAILEFLKGPAARKVFLDQGFTVPARD